MFLEHPEILFYLGDLFLNKLDLIKVSYVNKHFFKSTRRPKLGYLGINIISELELDYKEIGPFFDYLRKNKHEFQFNIMSDYRTLQIATEHGVLNKNYYSSNYLIKIMLDYFFFSSQPTLISLTETSKTCLEGGIISRIKNNDLELCRATLTDKRQLFRREFKNIYKPLTIKEWRHRQENLRKNFRSCYSIII